MKYTILSIQRITIIVEKLDVINPEVLVRVQLVSPKSSLLVPNGKRATSRKCPYYGSFVVGAQNLPYSFLGTQ